MWTARALRLLAYTFVYKINQITGAIGKILAFTGTNNCSYRRDISIYRKEDVLFQLKIRGTSGVFGNQPRHLVRPTSVDFCQHFWNPSHETIPLNAKTETGNLY